MAKAKNQYACLQQTHTFVLILVITHHIFITIVFVVESRSFRLPARRTPVVCLFIRSAILLAISSMITSHTMEIVLVLASLVLLAHITALLVAVISAVIATIVSAVIVTHRTLLIHVTSIAMSGRDLLLAVDVAADEEREQEVRVVTGDVVVAADQLAILS